MTQRVKNSPKQAQLGVTSLCANHMQIYIQKCPKIELRNRIAVRIRSVCSKFKVIYPALVLTLLSGHFYYLFTYKDKYVHADPLNAY